MVAHRAEPDLRRRRVVRACARRRRQAEGRLVPSPRRGQPRGRARRPHDARGDLALGDTALEEAPRGADRARAARCRDRLHRADGAPARDPVRAPPQVRDPRRLLRRGRADEPAGVRRHGHRLQLVPRGGPVGVRPRASRTPKAASSGCASSVRAVQRRSSGAPTRSSSHRRRSRRNTTCSSTATATSSGATGCRRWSASRRARFPTRTSHSAAATSRATPATPAPIGDIPFNVFARAISAARVNLCITRRSHATVYASSSCRPFELASAGAAIVSNPYNGLERWFEPGSELLIVEDAAQAIGAYRDLLADPGQAEEMGRRARERVLDEHTYRHRARQLLSLVDMQVPA